MKQNGFEVILISSEGSDWQHIQDVEDFKSYKVGMARQIAVLKDVKALLQLIWLFLKIKPQMVHSHTPKAGLLSMMAAKVVGVPVRLHTVAGLPLMEAKGVKRAILEMAEKITYSCASKVYPNSKNLKQFILQNKFCPLSKLKVIGNGSSNGIDTTYFSLNEIITQKADEIREQLKISADNFVFIFIGRVVQDKGIVELVKAFKELQDRYKKIRLLIVGPFEHHLDPLPADTIDFIQNNNKVMHVGFQSDVRPYLALSNALAFPSYREGFPNVPMQASCFNLPSIVTDINGCNEIIVNEKNGIIITSKDSIALKKAMERLITDNDLFQKLKLNARRMIVERYEQKHFWNLLLQEYKEQLSLHNINRKECKK